MGGFGERMQREREMRSITLEEIAESTKIGCRMLRALEQEDFDKLPGGIFNKGFVRAYAKFLGIDEEQAVTDFQAAFVEKQQRQATNGSNGLHLGSHSEVLSSVAGSAYADEHPQPDQAAGFMRAAVIIVILLGLGGLGWKFWGGKKPAEATASTPSTVTQPAPAVKAPEVITENTSLNPAAVPATSTETSTSATDNAAAPEAGKFRLRVHARETSWVQITADGKVLMAAELTPSGTRSFQAAKEMIVVLGNAPGVEISYNGKALPAFSEEQKTRTLTFTPEGLRQ